MVGLAKRKGRKPTITMGSKMAVATAACKRKGFKSFKKGTAGAACREQVARGIEAKSKVVKGPAKRKRG